MGMINKTVIEVKSRQQEVTPQGAVMDHYVELGKATGYFGVLTIEAGKFAHKFVEDSTHIFIGKTKLEIKQGDKFFARGKEYEVMYVDRPLWDAHAQIEVKELAQQTSQMKLPIYYGSTERKDLIEMDILNLENEEFSNKSFNKELSGITGSIVIAYPKTFGKASIRLDGRPIVDWSIEEMMIEGNTYYVYKTKTDKDSIRIELS